ncbi:MAG: class I SAM-dependent methyltransferase [Chitinophagaceae bacterium]|nr:class I SAM-dependent methyltransferase [Chitinophagaceae bacterium]
MKPLQKKIIFGIFDLILLPFSYIYLCWLWLVRRFGVSNFPLHTKAFQQIGVFPIRNHYYDPQFVFSENFDPAKQRDLHIDFKIPDQLAQLEAFNYVEELSSFRLEAPSGHHGYYLNNPAFGPGDAEMYYLLIRNHRPRKIIEIGSGYSTLVAVEALRKNKEAGIQTELLCIEPYEMPWLKALPDVQLIRQRVEEVDLSLFENLEENDILFIDSSHIIRPENDVLFEFFRILPRLKKGVLVHVHDIFSPRDYRKDWLTKEFRFWNEQYLLEAFLYYNDHFSVIGSLNHLKNDFLEETAKTLIHLQARHEPASFWMKKLK